MTKPYYVFDLLITVSARNAVKHLPTWLPGMAWKKTVTQLRPSIDTMNLKPFRACVQAMVYAISNYAPPTC